MDLTTQLLYGAAALAVGGFIKGIFGIGLPLVSVPLLTLVFSVPTTAALMVAPMAATNLVQIFAGGRAAVRLRLRRYAVMSILVVVTIIPASQLLIVLPEKILFAAIGVTVIVMTLVTRFRPSFRISERQEVWLGPLVGIVSGLLGGLTSFFGPPLLMYVAALRLPRDQFVGDISLLYMVAALGQGAGLASFGVGDHNLLALAILAVAPTFAGNWFGQLIRVRMTDHNFANALFVLYLVIAASFLARALP